LHAKNIQNDFVVKKLFTNFALNICYKKQKHHGMGNMAFKSTTIW